MGAEAIRVTRGGVYTPELHNEGRKDKEKIRVHWKFLSFVEQQSLLESSDLDTPFTYEGKITAHMITEIENLSVDDGDGARDITTGKELINEPTLEKLALEVWMHLRKQNSVDKKK
jgi:hypothetical protein